MGCTFRPIVVGAIFIVCQCFHFMLGAYVNPGLPADDFYQDGDIIIGALSPIYEIVPNVICGASRINNYRLQTVRAMIYTIDQINMDPTILPNISLGYVIVNDCERESVAVAKSTKFLSSGSPGTDRECPGSRLGDSKNRPYYKVAGFISPPSSAMSVPVSSVISLYEIPHMSWTASSQELSDKARFQYFSRVIPPDQFQSKVIVSIIRHFNWTYISTLHSEGSYGSNGIHAVQRLTKKHGICIAYSRELKFDENDDDFDDLVIQLRRNRKAKVIAMFVASQHVTALLNALERNHAVAEFILIGGDGYSPDKSLFPHAINSFTITWHIEGRSHDFETFYENLDPWWNSTGNPWFGEFRDVDLGCSWAIPASTEGSCHAYKRFKDVPGFALTEWYTLMMDAIRSFALGLHNLISERCPGAVANKQLLDACIVGPLYQQYLMAVKFQGVSGWIEFDENGDALGNYKIMHYRQTPGGGHEQVKVGTWERRGEMLALEEDFIQWHGKDEMVYISDSNEDSQRETSVLVDAPESVCAKPCQVGEFYIQGELKCCWECRPCRDTDRVRGDVQGCDTCPPKTWPDQVNFTTCETILPTYMSWLDPITMGLLGLMAIGLLSTLVITVIFVRNRHKKVVKGSNRELMVPIVLGLFIAYGTVLAYVTKPSTIPCYFSYFGFNLSCTLIFGPLFLKCNRLYRIFEASEKCKTRVRMVDSMSQMAFITVILIVQVRIRGLRYAGRLSACLSACLHVCLPACMSVCLSVYLLMRTTLSYNTCRSNYLIHNLYHFFKGCALFRNDIRYFVMIYFPLLLLFL